MKLRELWAKIQAHAWCAHRAFTVGGSYGVRSAAFVDAGKTGEMVYAHDERGRPIKVFYQTGPIPASIWRLIGS